MSSRTKKILDYLPFLFILAYTIYEWIKYYQEGTIINWRTWIGIVFLISIFVCYFKNHQLSILLTGLMCVLGICGLISLSPAITRGTFGTSFLNFTLGDPIFIAFFLLHWMLSFRWYAGVFSIQYWRDLKTKLWDNGR